jgi:hypothetical protein
MLGCKIKDKRANINFVILSDKSNKKAQVGETLTWAIATIIILVVLILFIYASIGLAKTKKIGSESIIFGESGSSEENNWIILKNSLAFSLNDKNKEIIEEWIKNAQE